MSLHPSIEKALLTGASGLVVSAQTNGTSAFAKYDIRPTAVVPSVETGEPQPLEHYDLRILPLGGMFFLIVD